MSSAKEMRELFDSWSRSGQSLMAFGKVQGVPYSKLQYWKRKFDGVAVGQKSPPKSRPDLVPIKVVAAQPAETPPPEKYEVWLGNGLAVDVYAGFDEVELRRLVGVLKSC